LISVQLERVPLLKLSPGLDPEQFQDPDNECGLFAGTTYEADDEEADEIYEQTDKNMDGPTSRRRAISPERKEKGILKGLGLFPIVLS